jgi:hypothetical protein
MTEHQAKHTRKLNQALNDIIKAMPDSYTLEQAQADLERLRGAEMKDGKRLSTKLIAGLIKWQMEEM